MSDINEMLKKAFEIGSNTKFDVLECKNNEVDTSVKVLSLTELNQYLIANKKLIKEILISY